MLDENLHQLREKYEIMMNVEEKDRERFKAIVNWCGEMMELSIKERVVREHFVPIRGEVWTANFGENVGAETNKIRPCLIIQENVSNEKGSTVIAIPITRHEPRYFEQAEIRVDDYRSVKESVEAPTGTVMSGQLRVISKARLGRPLGMLTDEAMKRVEKSLSHALGLHSLAKNKLTKESY